MISVDGNCPTSTGMDGTAVCTETVNKEVFHTLGQVTRNSRESGNERSARLYFHTGRETSPDCFKYGGRENRKLRRAHPQLCVCATPQATAGSLPSLSLLSLLFCSFTAFLCAFFGEHMRVFIAPRGCLLGLYFKELFNC